MGSASSKGRVYLVGAGPGDAGLLTLRAVECLRQADVVIYDKLVNSRLLDHAPRAERICVGDLHACHTERYPKVQELLIEAAKQGRTVVRLKGGDPGIFGRGGEEAEALKLAGIPYEIVPGVTAAVAASAYTGIPLTHREHSSAVAFVTGHECPGKAGDTLDWGALARFPGTLVIYMGVARLAAISRTLIEQGKSKDTPAAVVHWASTGRQRTIEATLGTISDRVKEEKLTAPAVSIIGPVVELRRELGWFEDRPLYGRSVLVTRPRHQAESLIRRLESLGAAVYSLPVIEIGPPPDLAAVDRAIAQLANCQWLVFTSANGVHFFIQRLLEKGRDLRALGHLRLAAIGPRTAEALRAYHLIADVIPKEYRSEGLADELLEKVRGQRILLARADRGREILREQLEKVGEVDQVAIYSQIDSMQADEEVLNLLRACQIDYVTLTSSNLARAFVNLLDAECKKRLGKETLLATLSPVTSAIVRELGFPVAIEAEDYTADGLVDALVAHAAQSSRPVSQAK